MFPKDTKILAVDDMLMMRKFVKKSLVENGYENVTIADDGDTAWPEIEKSIAEKAPFQLIVCDWNMPRMTGLALLKKVRETEGIKGVPFILLTAESEKEQIAEAVKSKVSDYILKPFTVESLMGRINKLHERLNPKK